MISLDFISVSVRKRAFFAHEMNVFVYFTDLLLLAALAKWWNGKITLSLHQELDLERRLD